MWGDFMTKLLQGSKFRRMRAKILNISEEIPLPLTSIKATGPQECVGTCTWADIVRRPAATGSGAADDLRTVNMPKVVQPLPSTSD